MSGGSGLFQVSGTHTYAAAGDYTVRVTLNPTVGPQMPFSKWVGVVSRAVGNPLWALPALALPAVQAQAKPTPQDIAISGVAKRAGETNEAGPDVTDWFARDIVDQLEYRAQEESRIYREFRYTTDETAKLTAMAQASLSSFKNQAKYLMSPKWMNFGSPENGKGVNTVVVHGRILRKNILGNILFGVVSDISPPFLFPNDPVRQAYITGIPFIDDTTQVSTYLTSHPNNKNFGAYAGKYRADNLAAFGVGHGIATDLGRVNIGGKSIMNTMAARSRGGNEVILTKEEKAQLVKEVNRILKDILTNEAALARRVNKYHSFMEIKTGRRNVTIPTNTLFFIPEFDGGFNTDSLKQDPNKTYPSIMTSREYFTKVVKEGYNGYAKKERDAGRTPLNLDDWLKKYKEDYSVAQ